MNAKRAKESKANGSSKALPTELQSTLHEANAAMAREDLAAAEEGFRAVLARVPKQVDALVSLGSLLTKQGRQAEALQCLRVANVSFKDPVLQNDIGVCFSLLGHHEEAISAFKTALNRQNEFPSAWVNLGHSLHEQGLESEAVYAFQRAAFQDPHSSVGWYWLGRVLFDAGVLSEASDSFSRAVLVDERDLWARFGLAMSLDLQGDAKGARAQFSMLPKEHCDIGKGVESWAYAREKCSSKTRFLASTRKTLRAALECAADVGMNLEFGVRFGESTRWIAQADPTRTLHGFDSFQGLPEDWHIQKKGVYSTHGSLPELPKNVELHIGWFDDTLPGFIERHEGPVRFMNIDCDLYSATRSVLDKLAERIVPGTVIVFDEYLLNDWWREDEFKAFQEVVTERGWRYEYLAFSVFTGQASVRITG